MYSFGRCPISLIVIFEAQFQNPQMLFLFSSNFTFTTFITDLLALCSPSAAITLEIQFQISGQCLQFAAFIWCVQWTISISIFNLQLMLTCLLPSYNVYSGGGGSIFNLSSNDVNSRCPNFQFFFRNEMLTTFFLFHFFWQSFKQFVI